MKRATILLRNSHYTISNRWWSWQLYLSELTIRMQSIPVGHPGPLTGAAGRWRWSRLGFLDPSLSLVLQTNTRFDMYRFILWWCKEGIMEYTVYFSPWCCKEWNVANRVYFRFHCCKERIMAPQFISRFGAAKNKLLYVLLYSLFAAVQYNNDLCFLSNIVNVMNL